MSGMRDRMLPLLSACLLLALFAVQPATSMAQQVQIYWVE